MVASNLTLEIQGHWIDFKNLPLSHQHDVFQVLRDDAVSNVHVRCKLPLRYVLEKKP